MWLVSIALRRPYTFVIMGLLIVLLGVTTISRMSTDILPEIDIPVVAIVWSYGGLPPEEMEKRITTGFERFLTTTVSGIEHTESQSLTGIAVIKAFFHPSASVDAATAQIAAVSQTTLRSLPAGATPPLILRYSASNAPVLQVALESEKLSEQQLFDFGVNFLRAGLATVQGAGTPYPYGGKQRQVMVDLDLTRLYAWGLSPRDVINALNVQNLTLPTGSIKLGAREYPVLANSSPDSLEELSHIPLRTRDGKTVFLSDVASVRDGFAPQTSLVHANGKRAVVMPILKSAGSSTLDVVSRVRAALPEILATLPKELKVTPLFDQSVFVRAAVADVVHEAIIAAGLTALMMLVFLGSWRSTLIVIVSIPLSILAGAIALYWCGESLNLMTLGGMSLAVGVLVDDATVELENIHRNLAQGKPLMAAILDGAREIAVPAFVSTLCICIVFLPIAFITGPARSLFLPLAMAVVFAMAVSYFLSRTLVPTLVRYLLATEAHAGTAGSSRFHAAFERGFERLRASYGRLLTGALAHPRSVIVGFSVFVALSVALFPLVGRDFFPSVDAGLIRLHVRAPPGTRIEATEQLYIAVGNSIREVIPPDEIETVINNIGVTSSPINLSMSDGTLISSADGEILIALKPGHASSHEYVRQLRAALAARHPGLTFFFLAPDISTQVLNFGTSAPVDIQVTGPPPTARQNLAIASQIERAVTRIPGVVDVRMQQVTNTPQLRVDVDRNAAAQVGLNQRDVAGDMLISLSSSGQTSPNFWLDPKKGIQYNVAVQTPQYRMDSLEALGATPIGTATGATSNPQVLTNVASFQRSSGATNITHHNGMPTYDVLANVDGTDLGSVARAIDEILDTLRPKLPRGSIIRLRGQVESMESSFRGLGYGLVLAIVLVYCVMVVNFQSWLDPFVILMALPGALAGIAWMLFVSQTTLSVPALMGTIMCIGVATANSILLVSFANDYRRDARITDDRSAVQAALAAGTTRLRPVLMTALAMIAGMLPMSLGLGDAGEQNAPLGRAVIGGLLIATLSTLVFVPVVYSVLRRKLPAPIDALDPRAPLTTLPGGS
jgi:CzcA family heavy metal efflux pump